MLEKKEGDSRLTRKAGFEAGKAAAILVLTGTAEDFEQMANRLAKKRQTQADWVEQQLLSEKAKLLRGQITHIQQLKD